VARWDLPIYSRVPLGPPGPGLCSGGRVSRRGPERSPPEASRGQGDFFHHEARSGGSARTRQRSFPRKEDRGRAPQNPAEKAVSSVKKATHHREPWPPCSTRVFRALDPGRRWSNLAQPARRRAGGGGRGERKKKKTPFFARIGVFWGGRARRGGWIYEGGPR